jgi:hypothetical protein
MTLFSLTLSPDFLMTLLFFLFLTNTGILGMIGIRTLSLLKARNLLRVTLISSTGS